MLAIRTLVAAWPAMRAPAMPNCLLVGRAMQTTEPRIAWKLHVSKVGGMLLFLSFESTTDEPQAIQE